MVLRVRMLESYERGSDLTSSTTTATFSRCLNNLIGQSVRSRSDISDWLKHRLRQRQRYWKPNLNLSIIKSTASLIAYTIVLVKINIYIFQQLKAQCHHLSLTDRLSDVNFRHSSQYCKLSEKLCTKNTPGNKGRGGNRTGYKARLHGRFSLM